MNTRLGARARSPPRAVDEHVLLTRREVGDADDGDVGDDCGVERPGLALRDAVVDPVAHEQRAEQRRKRRDRDEPERGRRRTPLIVAQRSGATEQA
ncbi:MAG: hypothetical protein WKF58_10750 [Ilumatobacteraceae bacterium]